jgi:putative Ca2+/H+ antiporter (TMEM165/GDT1 family)
MGDKAELATMTLASGPARWSVFAGAALALAATTLVAVRLEEVVSRVVSPIWIRRGAGAIFNGLGLLYVLGAPTERRVVRNPEAPGWRAREGGDDGLRTHLGWRQPRT